MYVCICVYSVYELGWIDMNWCGWRSIFASWTFIFAPGSWPRYSAVAETLGKNEHIWYDDWWFEKCHAACCCFLGMPKSPWLLTFESGRPKNESPAVLASRWPTYKLSWGSRHWRELYMRAFFLATLAALFVHWILKCCWLLLKQSPCCWELLVPVGKTLHCCSHGSSRLRSWDAEQLATCCETSTKKSKKRGIFWVRHWSFWSILNRFISPSMVKWW